MKILAFAYACEPQKGSEPGAGWAWARLLARLGETWIITRENNREGIETELSSTPEAQSLHFVYVDLSGRARSWKRGQRGVRLYYILWQRVALSRARELHVQEQFDLVWHLTLANAWMGSLAGRVGPPFVYGPVGGGTRPPWRLASALGIRGTVYEVLRAAAQLAGRYLNPMARSAWRAARIILVQNPETRDWLPSQHRSKAYVLPNALLTAEPISHQRPRSDRPPTALFAGRLLPLKGVAIAIRAIAATDHWRLVVMGDGSDAPRLRRLARKLHVQDRVDFKGWVSRDRVVRAMREGADAFLFPSLHEEAGLVVVEALGSGLPVVCLDRGGPPLLAGDGGIVLPSTSTLDVLVSRLAEKLSDGRLPGQEAAYRQVQAFTPSARLSLLRDLLRSIF